MKSIVGDFGVVSILAGGAGFIGSILCRELIKNGKTVVVIDNLSRGKLEYIDCDELRKHIFFIKADLAVRSEIENAFIKSAKLGLVDEVWHLAANSDIPAGVEDSDVDLKNTFLTTAEILRCMKIHKIPNIYFASSSAIYGDLGEQALTEDIGPLFPISNYGAMKLASEALISAACESHLQCARIFRFPNVVGIPATHGVILDFIRKLKLNQKFLDVLGDGTQRKAYLHVTDLVSGMLLVRSLTGLDNLFAVNIGPIDEGVYVKWIAEQVVKRMQPLASIRFGSGNRGWVGDVPRFYYSTERIQSLGWQPLLGSEEAVLRAIDEIADQEGMSKCY